MIDPSEPAYHDSMDPIESGGVEAGAPRIAMRGITKRYGELVANDGVDLDLRPGEIHALLGENGAGKTTLMKVLFGLVTPDAGGIEIDGEPAAFSSPRDALARGIGMVHQHFMLVPEFTVAQNVALGSESPTNLRFRDAAVREQVRAVATRFGIDIDPGRRVAALSIDLQQRVEILKLLYRGARVVILDEPTSTLGPKEVERLFEILTGLREQGRSVVVITHKLSEAIALADRVTVLRRGAVVATATRGELGEGDLVQAMVGRSIDGVGRAADRPRPSRDRAPVLEVRDLVVHGDEGELAVDHASFAAHAGEIVGIAGVEGNGQRELAESLSGLRPPAAGTILLANEDVGRSSPRALHGRGVSVITEDRLRWDLIADFTLTDNVCSADVSLGRYRRFGLLDRRAMEAHARRVLDEYNVQPPEPRALAGSLSGGNQQKVVTGREFSRDPILLVAAQPTRGVDVAATVFVHERLLALRAAGCATVLMSLDLDELLALSDRIVVLYRGRVAYERDVDEADVDEIANAMAGVGVDRSAA